MASFEVLWELPCLGLELELPFLFAAPPSSPMRVTEDPPPTGLVAALLDPPAPALVVEPFDLEAEFEMTPEMHEESSVADLLLGGSAGAPRRLVVDEKDFEAVEMGLKSFALPPFFI